MMLFHRRVVYIYQAEKGMAISVCFVEGSWKTLFLTLKKLARIAEIIAGDLSKTGQEAPVSAVSVISAMFVWGEWPE
jgi:hypothetical protein